MRFSIHHYGGFSHGLADIEVIDGGARILVSSLDEGERLQVAKDLIEAAIDLIGTNSPKYSDLQDFYNEWAESE